MDTKIEIKNTATALSQFEKAAIKYATSTENGDYKTGNKCYKTILKAVNFLKSQGEVHKLSDLLNHESHGVRLWAATYLLPVLESEGLKALEQIARESGIHSFTAKTTISEWKKGKLNL